MEQLTRAEQALLELTADVANAFVVLPETFEHGSYGKHDQADVYFHLLAIQNIILARVGSRAYYAAMPFAAKQNIIHESAKETIDPLKSDDSCRKDTGTTKENAPNYR